MIKKVLIIFLSVLCFNITVSAQSAAKKYIELYNEAAIRTMNQYGVPASIVLGVAIHESASGNSKIAKYLNNHFGMKGSSGPKPIKSAYKGYENVDASYTDFANLLKKRFSSLFSKYPVDDYKSWVYGIHRGGYAASGTWATQVMAIIKAYKLYEYDGPVSPMILNPQRTILANDNRSNQPMVYSVKKGDTLQLIAKRFQTTVGAIKEKNELKSNILTIGQQLYL
ncbi:glucosaminidase domain-containing protein [Pedobacter sp. P351]|uniref:glucosaminidase domain and LysM peptidoglycan-binding domain-containing protein n=1 Tax=Pedobacter superstes TaxID=3133441 RepID=UPI0030B3A55B